jgi:hypothetical protein
MSKPKVKFVGENGNVFNLLSICSRALRDARLPGAAEMRSRVFRSGSYDEAINIMYEYVDPY